MFKILILIVVIILFMFIAPLLCYVYNKGYEDGIKFAKEIYKDNSNDLEE